MAQPTKTASQIITDFELQVSDITELSSVEELSILNRVYHKVCTERPWEFLKAVAQGTVLTDATGSYITPPTDFAFFSENNNYTDNSESVQNNASPKVIFIIVNGAYNPYQIINFSDRRQYVSRSGHAYFDTVNNIIRFTVAPSGTSYEFDYIKVPALLTASDSPIFPGQFHDILTFGMATENEIIQLSPKATSYLPENNAKYQQYLLNMMYWNSQLYLN